MLNLKKFLPVPVSKARFACKIFMVVKIYINSAPALLTKFLNYFYFFSFLASVLLFACCIAKLTIAVLANGFERKVHLKERS